MKKIIAVIIMLTSLLSSTNAQQTGQQSLEYLEASPAGSKILNFIRTANEGNAVDEKWVNVLFSTKLIEKIGANGLIDFVKEIRETDGQLHLYDANRPEVLLYRLKAKGTKSNNWIDLEFHFEENPPYRITRFLLDVSDQPATAAQPIFPNNIQTTAKDNSSITDFKSITLPDTPAGRRMAELNKSFEKGTYETFLKNEFAASFFDLLPFAEALEMTAEIAEESGGYKFHSLLKDSPKEVEALVYPKKQGRWHHLILRTEENDPYKIAMVAIRPADPPGFDKNKFNSDLVQKTLDSPHPKGKSWVEGQLGKKLDDFLTEQFKNGFSGAALVVANGEKILYKGYGLADRANQYPNKATTLFDAGSIMKDFTDAAILKLEAAGKLSTEDPISKYLPDIPKDKQSITVHHLMWHASGLPDNHSPHDDTAMSFAKAMETIFAKPLRFEPGTERQYSNSGFTVLAAIIEKVSGLSYLDYIEKEIIQPAGLTEWAYFGQKDRMQSDNIAIAYDGIDRGAYNDPHQRNSPHWQILGAGGICLTLEALYRFSKAIKVGKVMPSAATKKFLEKYNPASTGKFGTPTRFFGGGSDVGFTMICLDFPEENAYVLMASNTANYKSPSMADPLSNLFLEATKN